MSSNFSVSTTLRDALSRLDQKVSASESTWNDQVGNNFRESVQAGIVSSCNQFIKELDALENFISQAKSKVP
jgi:uncharacterized protein YukE